MSGIALITSTALGLLGVAIAFFYMKKVTSVPLDLGLEEKDASRLKFIHGAIAQGAMAFLKDILIRQIGMKAIVVGRDYAFGKHRQGNVAFLEKHAQSLGFEVICEPWVDTVPGHARISSTTVRETVMAGVNQSS